MHFGAHYMSLMFGELGHFLLAILLTITTHTLLVLISVGKTNQTYIFILFFIFIFAKFSYICMKEKSMHYVLEMHMFKLLHVFIIC
jgi:hypothetical protein